MERISVNLLSEGNQQTAGGEEMLEKDDVSCIKKLHAQGWGIKRIARELSISRNTVRRYARDGAEAGYFLRNARKRLLSGEEEWLREKFFQHDGNADVVRQELQSEKGLTVSLRTVERSVKSHREELKRKELATVRFETPPGFQMQIDFGERLSRIGGERVRVHLFVAKLGFSRRLYVQPFEHENQQSWMTGIEGAFRHFGGVPQQLLIDNASPLVAEHNVKTGEVKLTEAFEQFAAYWKVSVRACRPGRAQTKGKVENGVGYVKHNCIAGREFESWGAMEAHISKWLVEESDQRQLGDKGDTPQARFEKEERKALRPLDEGWVPFSPTQERFCKVAHDCFVDVGTNRYSVPWEHIGKEVQVHLTKEEVIISLPKWGEIARHKRSTERHKTIEKGEHFAGIIYQKDENKTSQSGVAEGIPELPMTRRPEGSELERSLLEYEKAVNE